jgi:hypothetical protein
LKASCSLRSRCCSSGLPRVCAHCVADLNRLTPLFRLHEMMHMHSIHQFHDLSITDHRDRPSWGSQVLGLSALGRFATFCSTAENLRKLRFCVFVCKWIIPRLAPCAYI